MAQKLMYCYLLILQCKENSPNWTNWSWTALNISVVLRILWFSRTHLTHHSTLPNFFFDRSYLDSVLRHYILAKFSLGRSASGPFRGHKERTNSKLEALALSTRCYQDTLSTGGVFKSWVPLRFYIFMPHSRFWSLTRETTIQKPQRITPYKITSGNHWSLWRWIQSSAGKMNSLWRVKTWKDSSVRPFYEWWHQASHARVPAMLPTRPPTLHMLMSLPAHTQVPAEEKTQWHGAFQLWQVKREE